jgi:small-conductance mechanosensitive channel
MTGPVAQLLGDFGRGAPYLASGVALGLFIALWGVVLWAGPRLGERIKQDTVEAVQSIAITVAGVLAAVVLVHVWQLNDEVWNAVGVVAFEAQTGVKVMVTLLVFGGAYTFTRITKQLVKRGERRDAISRHQREVAHHFVQIAVFFPAVLFTVALWGFRPQNLLLGAGAAGIVIGLAARQTLGAVLAGFVLLGSRPFEVGDWVVISGEEGVVTDVSIFNTQIRTFDNEQVVIPNDKITSENIVNRSRNGRLRITVDVGVDYDVEIQQAIAVAEGAMTDVNEVLNSPEPDAVLDRFDDSSVVLTLRFWIHDPTIERKWEAQNRVVEAVKAAFEAEGIKIPFPQRELTGREETGGFRVAGEARPDKADGDEPDDEETDTDDEEAPTPTADED